ncbi:Voltage-gated Ion Channel (VIC) Superfamily, partial [Thraustotheca clavata]
MNGTPLLVPGINAISKQARKLSQHDAESLARKASQMLCNPSVKRQVRGQVEKERREKLKKPCSMRFIKPESKKDENECKNQDELVRPEIKPTAQQITAHLSNIALKSVRQLKYKANTSALSESDRQTVVNVKQISNWTRFRKLAQKILDYRHFDNIIAIAVLLDTIVMAFDSAGNVTLGAIDLLFTLFFGYEMLLRFAAYHGLHHRSFFRSKWSFVYVGLLVACILSYCILGLSTTSQWRAIRGLKAYRCFTAVKGIRRILKTITKAVPLLANVGALAFFFLLMFSIIGLEAFPSVFDMQCALPTAPINVTLSLEDEELSYPVIYCSDNMKCAPDFICVAVDSSETSSYHSFQTGFASFLLVFQVMALDGWIDAAMEPAIQSTSSLAVVFFVFLIILFVFLVLNLFVAVITTAFMGHGDATVEDINVDKEHADATHGPIFDMRKMNKEDEEQHLYMVLGTTMAVEQAAVRGSLSSRENENENDDTNAEQNDRSNSTFNGGSTRRLTSAASLPVLTTMSFMSDSSIDLCTGTNIETQFREWLQSVPGVSGRLRRFILSENFADILMCFIVINTIALMCEYPNMGHQWQSFFDVIEFLFSIVFAIELLLKFYAFQSFRLYFHAYERWFDAIVVGSSLSISILKKLNGGSLTEVSWMDNVSILRTLRIGRLMWKWKGTRKLIESVMKSSRAMFNLLIFLGLYLLVHSVVAMQLFGVVHEMPRRNFHGFFHSFVTMFQVLSGDKWAEVMNSILERESLFFAPFFIVYIFFGQFVVLNIFIAVILENFAISEEEAYQLQLERVLAIPKELQMYEKLEEVGVRAFYANNDMRQLEHVQDVKARKFLGVSERENKPVGDNEAVHAKRCLSRDLIIPRIDQLLQSIGFKYFIILTIFLSCIGLAMDDPVVMFELTPSELASQNNKVSVLSAINLFALVVFALEFALKVASQGFGFRYIMRKLFSWYESQYYRSRFKSNSRKVTNKKHYIEDPWNRLDFALLVVALLDEAFSLINNQKSRNTNLVKVLRVGRVLRPLRLFNQDGDMKLIMTSFVAALPAVGD